MSLCSFPSLKHQSIPQQAVHISSSPRHPYLNMRHVQLLQLQPALPKQRRMSVARTGTTLFQNLRFLEQRHMYSTEAWSQRAGLIRRSACGEIGHAQMTKSGELTGAPESVKTQFISSKASTIDKC